MSIYTTPSGSSTSYPPEPTWIIFCAGPYAVRLPFSDVPEPADDGWQYVLDVTMMGFRADRIGDAVVITGRPSGFGGLAS